MKQRKQAMAKRGKLIVFEGADGSGKTTQSKLLVDYLKIKKIPAVYISFPRYEESIWAQMVKRYLLGEFGTLMQVDPYFASMLYAGDRFSASTQLKKWLNGGKIIVCNRYVGSNIAHMAAKIKNQREKYIDWLEKLEYGENKIPQEDLVLLLHVPVAVSRKLMKGRKLDIHELDLVYLEKVISVYDDVSKNRKNWIKVECTKNGQILKPGEVHEKVLEVLRKKNILRTV